MPGRIMAREMAEQPAVPRRLLDTGAARIQEVAREVAARRPRFVLLTARGTSDNAALYAKYLLEIRLGLPCGLTSMSTTTAYGARPDLTDVLVVTVSQSGGSPDLVVSTQAAREAGALTLAVTNNPDSPPAAVSEHHIDIMAGPERVLPATKTYTASLLALYLFVEGLCGGDGVPAKPLPDLAGQLPPSSGCSGRTPRSTRHPGIRAGASWSMPPPTAPPPRWRSSCGHGAMRGSPPSRAGSGRAPRRANCPRTPTPGRWPGTPARSSRACPSRRATERAGRSWRHSRVSP
jgi:SIS domain-containing protein